MSIQFIARLSLIVLSSFFVSAAALARPPFGGPPGPRGPEGFIEEHAERLGLDDETRAAIQAIVDESRERAAEFGEDHREARHTLRDLLSQDLPDEEAVMHQAELVGAIETQMMKHRLQTLLRIRARLTPEQRKELMALHRERHGGPEMVLEHCGGDLEELCPGAESPFERMDCLRDHADRVSEECGSALERPRHKRGPRPGPFGD